MSAPVEYYRKVIEIMCLRQVVHEARLCREARISYVNNSDLDTASLEDLNKIYEALMADLVDAAFDADGLPSVKIVRVKVGRALNGRFVSLKPRETSCPTQIDWELVPFKW
jgi:hypothetical protein